jgi:hypothetical protein
MKEGYLYFVSNDGYYEEALTSAKSLKRHDSQANITIAITYDREIDSKVFDIVSHVKPINSEDYDHNCLLRLKTLTDTPYDKTFYVDTDTYFCGNCREVFDMLDYYDLCMADAPNDMSEPIINGKIARGMHPYNNGVIAYKSNWSNFQLFSQTSENEKYLNTPTICQTPFCEALAQSKSRVFFLKSIYNLRTIFPAIIKEKVKIIHGRHKDLRKIEKELNSLCGQFRVWLPKEEKCETIKSIFQ